MKFFIKISVPTVALLFNSLVFAGENQPVKCPNVEVIKQAGLDDVRIFGDNTWAATNTRDNYGTSFLWTFVLGSDYEKVKDITEARQRAMQELQTLTFKAGPYYAGNGDTACLYNTNKINSAMLITPPLHRF